MTACLVGGAAGPAGGRYDADIIILALERPAETAAAIMSACAQTGVSTHVFVLDQGSCPETVRQSGGGGRGSRQRHAVGGG